MERRSSKVDAIKATLRTVHQWIWHGKPERVHRRIAQRFSRVVLYLVREIAEGNLQLNARSLSYITLLSLVPLLAVSFSVLKAFGSDQVIAPFLATLLEPLGNSASQISAQILTFVSNIKVGVLGAVGIAMLFFTVVTLMQKIETVFNGIWHVGQLRPIATRLPMYLSVLMVGPVLILAATGLTASLIASPIVSDFTQVTFLGDLLASLAWLVPFVLWMSVFTFIYLFVPNTSVHFSSALAGGFVTAILWNGVGLIFGSMIAGSAQYTAIYATFASLILFMIWLQLAWLVVLLGAAISYAWQNINRLYLRQNPAENHVFILMTAALESISLIENRFHNAQPAPSSDELKETLANTVKIDPDDTQRALEHLAQGGLINCVINKKEEGWVPAMPAERLNLALIRATLWGHPESKYHKIHPVTQAWIEAEQQFIEHSLVPVDLALNQGHKSSANCAVGPQPTDLQANTSPSRSG